MSYRTTNTDVAAAIERSRSHDEIVTIEVDTEAAARALVDQLVAAAADDEETDWTDSNEGYEVWGYDPATPSDAMDWRVHVVPSRAEA